MKRIESGIVHLVLILLLLLSVFFYIFPGAEAQSLDLHAGSDCVTEGR